MNPLSSPLAHGKLPFISLFGGEARRGRLEGEEQRTPVLFPWWRRFLAWGWARLRGRRAYQVGPAMWRSERVVTMRPEIYDYELPDEADEEDDL